MSVSNPYPITTVFFQHPPPFPLNIPLSECRKAWELSMVELPDPTHTPPSCCCCFYIAGRMECCESRPPAPQCVPFFPTGAPPDTLTGGLACMLYPADGGMHAAKCEIFGPNFGIPIHFFWGRVC